MRLVHGDVNVYYYHDTLTPGIVRAASYGTAYTSGTLVPEVGDILHNFPGWTGTKYEPITVRVTEVKSIGNGCEAYGVTTTTVRPDGNVTLPRAEYLRLLRASLTMDALEAAGVDNWEGYGEVDHGEIEDALAGAEAGLGQPKR